MTDAEIFSGAEIAMFAAVEALARRGVHVAVAVPPPAERQRPHLDRLRGMDVQVLAADDRLTPGPHGLLSHWLRRGAAQRATELVRRAAPRAVLINLPTLERGPALVDAVRRSGPVEVLAGYVHLAQPPSVIGARAAVVRDRLVPSHLRRFDLLLTVCEDSACGLRRMTSRPVTAAYPASTAVLKRDWLDREEARRRLRLGSGPLIGLFGRVEFHQKGHDTAVRVAAQLRRAGMAARWVIVGDGPDLDGLRRLVDTSNLTDQFLYLGWRGDVEDIVPALDVVVLPSRFEGLPLTAVESIAARVPVVAFAVDGLKELLDPPFAVPPFDEGAFGAALRGVLDGSLVWPAERLVATAERLCHPDAVAGRILAALQAAGLRS